MKIKLELRKEDLNWYFNTPIQEQEAASPVLDEHCTGGFWHDATGLDPRIGEFLAKQAGSAVIPVILDIPGIPL